MPTLELLFECSINFASKSVSMKISQIWISCSVEKEKEDSLLCPNIRSHWLEILCFRKRESEGQEVTNIFFLPQEDQLQYKDFFKISQGKDIHVMTEEKVHREQKNKRKTGFLTTQRKYCKQLKDTAYYQTTFSFLYNIYIYM